MTVRTCVVITKLLAIQSNITIYDRTILHATIDHLLVYEEYKM